MTFNFLKCSYSLWIPFDPFGVKMMLKGFSGGAEYVKKYIAKHRATLDPANPRDYIDAFLIEMNAHANSEEEHFFTGSLSVH